MSPAATFAIPCWQGERFLPPLLGSLLAQTRQDFTLLLVDDASDDRSVDVAREVAGGRIRIERNPRRLGLAANWNRCASLVETPFFCLAHMDDVYAPDYLARMLEVMAATPDAGMAHCRASTLDATGQPVTSPVESFKERFWDGLAEAGPAEIYARLYRGNFINCPSVLYATEAWRAAGPFPEHMRFAPDWWLAFRMLLAGWKVVGVPEVLMSYRRHPDSATRTEATTLARYAEELAVLRWARQEGEAAGLLDSGTRFSPALRNNLLLDAYCDLQNGEMGAARSKLRFAAEHAPEVARDPMVRAFAVLTRLGAPGRAVLGLGLRAVVGGGLLGRVLAGIGAPGARATP